MQIFGLCQRNKIAWSHGPVDISWIFPWIAWWIFPVRYVTYVTVYQRVSDVFRNMSDFWRRISDCFRNLFPKSWRPWITFENPGQLCFRNIACWIESLNSTLHCITLRIMYAYMYIEFYVRFYLHCIYFTFIYCISI